MTELKPCPFCGGEAFIHKEGDSYFVECIDCWVKMPDCDSEEWAEHYWNRRTNDG